MNCPKCGRETSVINSRPIRNGAIIRRRRICPNGHRFSTEEKIMVSGEVLGTPDDPGGPGPDYHIGERLTGGLEDYVDMGPAEARDSLKYACMGEGFRHRPVPPGSTKRKAYCSICKAPHCVHHPDLSPEQVAKRAPNGAEIWRAKQKYVT